MQHRVYIAAGAVAALVLVGGYFALKPRRNRLPRYDPTAPLHGAKGSKKRKRYEQRLVRERATLAKEIQARPGAASCNDLKKNFDETDVDCGGTTCGACDNQRACRESPDCKSGYCSHGTCAPWASAVALGAGFSCALTVAGTVKCWGSNDSGQLGDGTFRERVIPVDVEGVSAARMIAVGGRVSGEFGWVCALAARGVQCWGKNPAGTLGVDGVSESRHPIDVPTLATGVTSISLGTGHACVVTTEGAVKCWGDNAKGQLGDGTTTSRSTPVAVPRLTSGVAAVSARGLHTCALTTSGGVLCWGNNGDGELGDGTVEARNVPTEVPGLGSGVVAISCGIDDACAVLGSGAVKCWGNDEYGELGNRERRRRVPRPTDAALDVPAVAVSAGPLSTCAVSRAGSVICWGHGGDRELGDGQRVDNVVPRVVDALKTGGTAMISVDKWHVCDVTTFGGVKCWGMNERGELGDGHTSFRAPVVDVIVP